jgi:hypothetical protein
MEKAFVDVQVENIRQVDQQAVDAYNVRTKRPECRLMTELGPLPYDGDIENARVAVLLSNPGFGAGSTSESHSFKREGWPLSGLHPEAPDGTRKWQHKLLKHVVELVGDAKLVSQRVVKLELVPWASHRYDSSIVLPSRPYMLEAAAALAKRGVLLVIISSEAIWKQHPVVAAHKLCFSANSPRSSTVSPGNLSEEAWHSVAKVMTS